MDSQWHHQDPHPRFGSRPKVTLAGRIDASINGRPFSLIASDQDLVLTTNDLKTLLNLKGQWPAFGSLLRRFFSVTETRLLIRYKRLNSIEVFPRPARFVRWILPSV